MALKYKVIQKSHNPALIRQ